jgi:valyl-tRNA synthetase
LSGTSLENSESIMIKPFPNPNARNLESEKLFSQIIDAIVSIRRLKATIDLANKPIPEIYLYFQNRVGNSSDDEVLKLYIQKLAKVENVKLSSEAEIENSFSDVGETVKSFILAGNIDLNPVLNRLKKQEIKLQKEIGKLEGMLKNKRFLEKAPKKVVEENQEALKQAKNKISIIQSEIEKIIKLVR